MTEKNPLDLNLEAKPSPESEADGGPDVKEKVESGEDPKTIENPLAEEINTGEPGGAGKTFLAADVDNQFYKPLPFINKFENKKFLSLDIDVDKIRYVVAKKSGKHVQIIEWGIQKFPQEESQRFKALQITLENIRAKIYKTGMEVHASIFSPEISIRQITLPKMRKKADLEKAIYFKNQTDLQNFDEKSVWSFEILKEFEEDKTAKLRIMIMVVPRETVEKYLQVFNNSKLVLSSLLPRPAALQAAYLQMVKNPQHDLVINISYDFTQVCFLKEGQIEYIRNIGIGARNLEVIIRDKGAGGAIDEDLSVPGTKAGQSPENNSNLLRERLMAKVKDLQQKQNPVLHTFFSEILRSIAYIQGQDKNGYVDRIFVTGYGIRKESLIPYLRNRLNLPVTIIAPQFTENASDALNYGEFFTTIGNLLQKKNSFNLLPSDYKHRVLFKKLNYFLVILISFSFLGAGYYSFLQMKVIRDQGNLVTNFSSEYDKLNPVEGVYNNFLKMIDKVSEENNELRNSVVNPPPMLDVLRLFSNETPEDIRLESIEFKQIVAAEDSKGRKKNIGLPEGYYAEVYGNIKNDLLVGDVILINFINRLKELGYFQSISLLRKDKNFEESTIYFGLRVGL